MRVFAPVRFLSGAHRSLRLRVTLVLGLVATSAAAGCGASGPLGGQAPPAKTTDGRSERALGRVAGGGQIAAAHGYLAVVAPTKAADRKSPARLLVATGARVPEPAEGAGAIPRWAQPHVGTDRAGKVLITYPRCSGPTLVSCDVYGWSPATQSEAPLAGTARGATRDERRMKSTRDGQTSAQLDRIPTAETEAVIERGVVVLTREWPDRAERTVAEGPINSAKSPQVWIRPTRTTARTLEFRGGRGLALSAGWVAWTHVTGPPGSIADGCRGVAIELTSLKPDGHAYEHVPFRVPNCGESGRQLTAPVLIGDRLLFGETTWTGDALAHSYDPKTGDRTKGSIGRRTEAWAPTSTTAGYALGQTEPIIGCDQDGGPADDPQVPCTLTHVSGLVPKLKKQPTTERTSSGVVRSVIHAYPGRVALAARGRFLAVAVAEDRSPQSLQLRVSPDGSVPVVAEGAGRIPLWARIHVGSDSLGAVVVTYPRCETLSGQRERLSDCDLYAWNAATRTEVPLDAVNTPGAETEAVMGDDNVLFVRETKVGGRVTHEDYRLLGTKEDPTLLYKPVGGPVRTVLKEGGRQIDLSGNRATLITERSSDGEEVGLCGVSKVQSVDLSGAVEYARSVTCGLSGGAAIGPSIQGGHLRFATTVQEGGSQLYDHPIGSKTLGHLNLNWVIHDWAAIDGTSSYALRDRIGGASCGARYEGQDAPTADCELLLLKDAKLPQRPIRQQQGS